MNTRNYKEVFTKRHAVLPVIHVSDYKQTLYNAKVARDAGADGVFLINGRGSDLVCTAKNLKFIMPDMFIGINCLGMKPHDVMLISGEEVGGIWCDQQLVVEDFEHQEYAELLNELRELIVWQGLLFGGMAFKYQHPVKDFKTVAELTKKYAEVPTTSGARTGYAPETAKIKALRTGLGATPMAIASGLTPKNIAYFLDDADAFLVATGVSKSYHYFDEKLLTEFIEIVRLGISRTPEPGEEISDYSKFGFHY